VEGELTYRSRMEKTGQGSFQHKEQRVVDHEQKDYSVPNRGNELSSPAIRRIYFQKRKENHLRWKENREKTK